jgi:hypothetical protein
LQFVGLLSQPFSTKLGPYVDSEVGEITKVINSIQVLVRSRAVVQMVTDHVLVLLQEENKEHRISVCDKIIDMMKLGIKRCAKLSNSQPLLLLAQVAIFRPSASGS